MLESFDQGNEEVSVKTNGEMEPHHMVAADMHQTYEIFYLSQGTCIYFVEGRSYPLKKGALIFIPPGQIHRTESLGRCRTTVKISGALLDLFELALPELQLIALHREDELIVQLSSDEQREIEALLIRLKQAFSEPCQTQLALIRLRAVELAVYVGCHLNTAQAVRAIETSKYQRCQKVSRYLREHYSEPVSLNQLCSIFYVSRYHLCRIFREVTGVTVMNYLLAIRVQNACMRLADDEHTPVAKVAMECGFDSLSSFNRAFHARIGTSPTLYRKQVLRLQKDKKR